MSEKILKIQISKKNVSGMQNIKKNKLQTEFGKIVLLKDFIAWKLCANVLIFKRDMKG